jgi:hypothetical protein
MHGFVADECIVSAYVFVLLLLRKLYYLSRDLAIILSTEIQNWHAYNAFEVPNSTAQCE